MSKKTHAENNVEKGAHRRKPCADCQSWLRQKKIISRRRNACAKNHLRWRKPSAKKTNSSEENQALKTLNGKGHPAPWVLEGKGRMHARIAGLGFGRWPLSLPLWACLNFYSMHAQTSACIQKKNKRVVETNDSSGESAHGRRQRRPVNQANNTHVH
jgi:hypothetical protein